ncbi:MAG: hypothetical protein PVJ04_16250 [Gemmatimonadota bacterium]|jgi:hypothetical protein
MRRKLLFALIPLNCLLAIALLARVADTQVIPRGLFDCCKDVGEAGYCCDNCCWFIHSCRSDDDCQGVVR